MARKKREDEARRKAEEAKLAAAKDADAGKGDSAGAGTGAGPQVVKATPEPDAVWFATSNKKAVRWSTRLAGVARWLLVPPSSFS